MFRKIINSVLFLHFATFLIFQESLIGQPKNYIDKALDEKEDEITIDYDGINSLIINNQELKSLQELVTASSFNLSSKISQKYPSLDLQANGLPKYVAGKNHNSNLATTKTSQISANPSLTIRWDLIDPVRGSEIKIARENYNIRRNNFEIKRKDLIQEAQSRFHKFQKSFQDIENSKYSLDLSKTSLNNAQAKLDAGIGTKFEVLEADAQLSRDQQSLNEKKIEHEINKISLKEIFDIKGDIEVDQNQKIRGFWNYKLNKNITEGFTKSLSLKNILFQKEVKKNEAISFLNANKPIVYVSNTFSSAFTKGDISSTLIDPDEYGSSYTNTISLNFSWNVFNGGQNQNSYNSRKSQAAAEENSYKNLKNVLRTNITKAYLNLKLNEEKIMSSLKEISSTQESLRLSRLRYNAGISTLKDVLIRQKDISNAKSKSINAIYNYNLNLDELERLTFLEKSDNCIEKDNINGKESICNILR